MDDSAGSQDRLCYTQDYLRWALRTKSLSRILRCSGLNAEQRFCCCHLGLRPLQTCFDVTIGHCSDLVKTMNRIHSAFVLGLVIASLSACQGGSDDSATTASAGTAVHSKPEQAAEEIRRSPGNSPTPITIDYEIMALPVVGIPLSINVKVTSELDEPITVNYRINDSTSLMFTEAQSERVSLVPVGEQGFSAEQVTVIPQREGRLFLNVSAEIETEMGMLAKVMAIPIQVGSLRAAPQSIGRPSSAAAGEAPVSVPAKEE